MYKALMIQGIGSGAGKSLIVTALCRIFKDEGISVAPFKAQNMALNSYITIEGGEIGRAQALQAEAARIEPTVDMNPVLLKASGEIGSQVIIHGKVHSTMKAKEYYSFKEAAWEAVKESFGRISKVYDLIIMEGAGSPAEINLMDVDIVNMKMARYARAPVILVGDIDRGGVFASLYGTVKLLGRDSRRIKGFVINKFRGDIEILSPGLEMIKDRTGKPVIGVLPYIKNIGLPEEDGLVINHSRSLESKIQDSSCEKLRIVIVKLQYISNFTDFDPFLHEPDVELLYSANPAEIENADIVIIPGTKNTVKDLEFLRDSGLQKSILKAYMKGVQIIGICGGYQILGKKIYDPYRVESGCKEINGIGLLNIETIFEKTKITARVEAEVKASAFNLQPSMLLRGYEIHMGKSEGDIGLFKINRLNHSNSSNYLLDGSMNGNCWGTYLHGIFENDEFRRAIINSARKKKGLLPLGLILRYSEVKDRAIDSIASIVKDKLDMGFIWRLIRL
jgi:adenosylcobyric acid synthase